MYYINLNEFLTPSFAGENNYSNAPCFCFEKLIPYEINCTKYYTNYTNFINISQKLYYVHT